MNITNFGSSWEFLTKTFPYPPFKNHEIIDLDGSTVIEKYGYSSGLEGASTDILWKFSFNEKKRYIKNI